jgi:DNA ligase-associated metallophosphoesterase
VDIDCGVGTPLRLLPQRAALLVDAKVLLVADAHFGKAQSFRRLGVPVPRGTTADALARLDVLLASTGARMLVFLGDLLHAARGRTVAGEAAVGAWRARHAAVEMVLVRGNHDRHAGDPPRDWGLRCVDGPLRIGPWALVHHPQAIDGAHALAGHVHPAVSIAGRAHERLRLPCFHFGAGIGVLPAFGDFTGSHVVRPSPGDRVFVVDGQRVRALPQAPAALAPDAPPRPLTTLPP